MEKEEKKKPFILPEPSGNNDGLYLYLKEERGLSGEVIHYFLKADLIYEEKRYQNIVFKGRDKAGVTRFASMRGIRDTNGKGFKCDVAGNDKRYGFNVQNDNSRELLVFEGGHRLNELYGHLRRLSHQQACPWDAGGRSPWRRF